MVRTVPDIDEEPQQRNGNTLEMGEVSNGRGKSGPLRPSADNGPGSMAATAIPEENDEEQELYDVPVCVF